MKKHHLFARLLVMLIISMIAFAYLYHHHYGNAGFKSLKNYLIGFSVLMIFMSWFAFSDWLVRLLAMATALALLIWIAVLPIDHSSTSLLLNIVVIHPKLIPMFSFIVLLALTIIFAFMPFEKYRYVSYCIVSMLILGVSASVIIPAMSLAYLHNSYEIAPVDQVAKMQQITAGYYLPLHGEYQYKLALYKVRKPDVVVIGTSRVLAYNQHMFNVPFVNMGRTLGNFASIRTFNDMLKIHKPKVIIWGMDWWDLINKPEKTWHGIQYTGNEIMPVDLLLPYQWIFSGKITLGEFVATALGRQLNYIDNNSYGVQARHHLRGYANDGAFYYFADIKGIFQERNVQFAVDKKTILNTVPTAGYFQAAADVPPYKWVELKAIQQLLSKNHIKLIIFIAPEPPAIIAAMQKSKHYQYLQTLNSQAHDFGPYYYNYLDAKQLRSNDCEFIDALHSGDVVAMRVLLSMSKDHANGLYQLVNVKQMETAVKKYAGRTTVPVAGMTDDETDFLGLGCKKSWKQAINVI
jgi:hypothetical protein